YWYLIGPGGSMSFNPYSVGGGDQGTYDNTLAVAPDNAGKLLLGGTTLWSWQQRFATDTVGYWTSLTTYGGFPGDPYHIHPDEHAIEFDPLHPNIVYVGCDGGIYKSLDGGVSWQPMNRNYNVTQFNAIAVSPFVDPIHGEGIMGGTQDNGTPYINGSLYYYEDQAADLSGGDGGGAAISYVNPNVFFTSIDYGTSLARGSNLSGVAFPGNFYNSTVGLNKGANIDSVAGLGSGCFVLPVALYENISDPFTVDSIIWIADSAYGTGHVVYPISPNGGIPYPYTLPVSVAKGDTIKVQNTVVSKLATGFSASNGVWMTMQAADLSDAVIWMPIGGPKSKPDGFNGNDAVHCLHWTPDGDAIFVGTEAGQFYRFSNLDSIRDTSYNTGATYSVKKGNGAIVANALCKVISKNLGSTFSPSITGRDILSISVDQYDGNKVVVTVGNYGLTNSYVYYSNNALSAAPTFIQKQGSGLPNMPVYSSILGLYKSGFPNSVVIGTEHGVYSTKDITVASPVWTPENNGAANTLVLAMKQQTLPPYLCNNSGNIYMSTHGRGFWYSGTLGPIPASVQNVSPADQNGNLKVYPNPMSTEGTVEYTLASEDNLTLTIYDIQGREVQNVTVGKQAQGKHILPISTEKFSNGTYLLNITGSNFHKTTRIVVVK
ncbi:MAG TPA: T9SS type A sorting domain-containing protein, partial [Bacteroidia bacterium]|nr:T9SS type A sorting domain-containing protein [Bacteroidia bacterium]